MKSELCCKTNNSTAIDVMFGFVWQGVHCGFHGAGLVKF